MVLVRDRIAPVSIENYRNSAISCIFLIAKEDKDLLQIKNYRPILLLNVDYKILSKVLSLRVTQVLDEIILEDQMGFMKGRNLVKQYVS